MSRPHMMQTAFVTERAQPGSSRIARPWPQPRRAHRGPLHRAESPGSGLHTGDDVVHIARTVSAVACEAVGITRHSREGRTPYGRLPSRAPRVVKVGQDLVLLSVDHSRASAARDSASRPGGCRHLLMDRNSSHAPRPRTMITTAKAAHTASMGLLHFGQVQRTPPLSGVASDPHFG